MSYYNDRPQGYGGGYGGGGGGYGGGGGGYGGQDDRQSYGGPPQVPDPWVAEWDQRDRRWIFINRENGERTFQHPQPSYGGGGYGERGYGQSFDQGYGQQEERRYEQQPQKKDHHTRNTVLAGAGGLVAGAFLMHEGEKVENKFEDAKYDVEDDVRRGAQDVADFPDDAARWTGNKVQEVEDIPQDVGRKWDNAVQDVEDVPDDVAGWAGRRVGDVERFDDRVEDSYDQGRDDRRYEDDY